ncbi:LCP family protein [Candidatus Formimonas warabiya]|uniref:Cell envelope-related transcriptional attenuator domain-containing protein n=1 Tax=Formimonas warabiya TaxID=1761012 RepID=A0A3G1KP51_FORW1|nr:LCP family protein [Candidatus Formimonas warabiya]ATW24242.1 hypothetical protein DCMF_05080 [Candidatus Formimonas warabiya]
MKFAYWKIGLIIFVTGIMAVSGYLMWGKQPTDTKPVEEDWIQVKGRINILLLGTDEKLGTNSRTDTIILASLDTKEKKISLLSIPRDTRVNIPGFGENKVNAANQLGGIELAKETISNLIKVPIDYYVVTNFDGFSAIVDTLGGVEIDVEQNMKYHVYDGDIDLKKGLQRLDGEKALQYVRFRHDKLGDISRTQRQQKFLAALAKEMMQAKNIIKLPVLIPELNKAVETDLKITDMIGLAKDYHNYDVSSITVQTLPGNFVNINGGSYWFVDAEKAHQVVLEVFAGNSADIIDDDVKATADSSKPKKSTPSAPKENNAKTEKIPPEQDAPQKDNLDNNTENNDNVPPEEQNNGSITPVDPVDPTDPTNSTDPEGSDAPSPEENQNEDPVVIPEQNSPGDILAPENPENNQDVPNEDSLEETSPENTVDSI